MSLQDVGHTKVVSFHGRIWLKYYHHRVAKYREANPGVYTIVTFPFLFAVMFGDWGHGICLLLATLYFIIRERKFSSQVMVHGFRTEDCRLFPLIIAVFYNFYLLRFVDKQKLGDIIEMTFGGRYVIFMMALFSIYTGLIYNEFFSVPFEIFGPSAYGCRDPSCRYTIYLRYLSIFLVYHSYLSWLY